LSGLFRVRVTRKGQVEWSTKCLLQLFMKRRNRDGRKGAEGRAVGEGRQGD
jgi:hypothetical protein